MSIPDPPWHSRRRTLHGRGRRIPRPPITQERIVEAALTLLRREGYDAVTMRRLATELGTGPASMYAHVENKRELDQLVINEVIDPTLIPDADPERWQEQLKESMRAMFRMFRAHPGVARATMGLVPTGPNALRSVERTLAILKAGKVPDQIAAWACDLIPLYVTALAYEESLPQVEGDPGWGADFVEELRGYFGSLPVEQFPLLVAMAVPLTSGGPDERFEFGISVIVEGIAALSR